MYVYICLNTVNPSLINVQNELRTDNETASELRMRVFCFPWFLITLSSWNSFGNTQTHTHTHTCYETMSWAITLATTTKTATATTSRKREQQMSYPQTRNWDLSLSHTPLLRLELLQWLVWLADWASVRLYLACGRQAHWHWDWALRQFVPN